MKNRFIAAIMILGFLALTLSGCKNEVDEYVGLFDGMTAVADENKGDCDKQKEALGKYLEDNKSKIEEIGTKIKDNDSKMTSSQEKDLETAMDNFKKATEECPEAGFMMLGLLAPLMGE